MSNFNVGDLVLVQLTPGAVGQRATVTDVYGDEYYGVRVEDSGLDTGLSGKFISLIKRNEGQTVTGIVGPSQPVTGESEQSNEDDDLLGDRDELTGYQLADLYRIGEDWDCTEDEVDDALDDIFGEDDWTFEDLRVRLNEYLCEQQDDEDDEDDEDDDISPESPSELRQNLNEVRAELEACRTRAADAEAKVASQEAEIRRLKLRAEEAEAKLADLDRCKENTIVGPNKEDQVWRAANDKVEQWYKERPLVSKVWDIPVMNILTGRIGMLEDFSYTINACPVLLANVRVPDGSIEQWYTNCLIPMEHVLAGIKSHRSWKELGQHGYVTLATSGTGIEVAKA